MKTYGLYRRIFKGSHAVSGVSASACRLGWHFLIFLYPHSSDKIFFQYLMFNSVLWRRCQGQHKLCHKYRKTDININSKKSFNQCYFPIIFTSDSVCCTASEFTNIQIRWVFWTKSQVWGSHIRYLHYKPVSNNICSRGRGGGGKQKPVSTAEVTV
jgi:hypothetical protein